MSGNEGLKRLDPCLIKIRGEISTARQIVEKATKGQANFANLAPDSPPESIFRLGFGGAVALSKGYQDIKRLVETEGQHLREIRKIIAETERANRLLGGGDGTPDIQFELMARKYANRCHGFVCIKSLLEQGLT